MLTGSEIRRKFLDYFVRQGHKEVHSSSLVPANDPTLLFTNAGMNQFKDVFLGLEKRDYNRATTSQKCVRAGGKHNDLENVGFTNRHHTFFEMLGNFSFGDYFKKDAIAYAWELLTSQEWFGIPKDKLYITIFKGENGVPRDAEAYDLWVGQNVPKERIYELGAKDNFWQMGDTGPCGPCSEIHYDMGVIASDQGHTDCEFGCDCGRYVEIWNLVFMQFDRDASGKLNPLPKPSIDTGAGLERLAAVMQGVVSNYDTDLFVPLVKRAAELTGTGNSASTRTGETPVSTSSGRDKNNVATGVLARQAEQGSAGQPGAAVPTRSTASAASLRVIADHARAATFLISDGVLPSNEGRGYVLRKIIRRAITHGRLSGQTKPFLHEMAFAVRDLMQDAYPELKESIERVSKTVLAEELHFAHTLDLGLNKLEELLTTAQIECGRQILAQASEDYRRQNLPYADEVSLQFSSAPDSVLRDISANRLNFFFPASGLSTISRTLAPALTEALEKMVHARQSEATSLLRGEDAFKLYDTFGMPLDFIQDAARDRGVTLDQAGFDSALDEQKTRARASWKGAAKQTANPAYQQLPKSIFEGYRQTRSDNCEVLAIIHNGQGAQELKPGENGEIILDHTPFYAESGGQVGDRGWLYSDDHNTVVAEVKGCYSPIQGVRAHQVIAKQPIRIGDKVDAVVDTGIRESTMRNHTATHLLQAGLREVLGKHVKQAGSLVAPNHLRFDFSHFTGVADEELQDIEDLINKEVLRNQKVEVIPDVPIDVAINEYHAMALFGEKYGDRVRVIRIGDFSTELCGGTHTAQTGEIGLIKILKEGSVSSGVRRIEAVTGEGSLRHFQKDHQLENVVASFVGPTLSQKTRKDGAPTSDDAPLSPAAALTIELDKKDAEIKRLQRELDQARMKSASSTVASVNDKIKDVGGVKVLAHRVDNLERGQMRTLVDQLRDKVGSGIVVLGSANDGNVSLIVGVTKDLTSRVQAGKVIAPIAQKVGGKGGGRPDLAEAGGKDAAALDAALGEAYGVVEGLLEK
ncbi:MAG TPA: alanine--tRNA ligase [Terriglobales bacterium]|nr:alanine--tRNA ligase [Terriglobales bacterium]